ncbi:MAG: adenylosuccinate lyase [Candidatus Sumerlaeaceae bacterium]|nr:adenylosuccinate lyase [Candidatus Sumerlaeaceae bacterium]
MIERYSTPEMRDLWSERAKFAAWLEVELAACEVWAENGRIPAEDLWAIKHNARFDEARIAELERTLHHDVIAFTTNLAENIGPAARHVHLGLTSNDVVDTAQSLRLRSAGRLIMEEVAGLISDLRQAAIDHKEIIMIGRTHGVHAEPITLGFKFLIYYQEMLRNRTRLEAAFADAVVGKISGAVGTCAHTGPDFEKRVCAKLGLPVAPVSTQVLQRDRHAALVCALAVCGATIEKIATEIRGLQRTEVREVEEPFSSGQKGSSAMPHKRNPVKCEQLCGLARLLRGYVVPALENIALWHERDISHSSAERVILPDATTLLHYMLRLTRRVVTGLHIYPGSMKRNLERTRGLVFSQRIMLALVEAGMSREEAYEVVQSAAMKTWENEASSLRQHLLADPRFTAVMTAEQLDAMMNYASFLRHLNALYDRALR